MSRKTKPASQLKIAKERIAELFRQAEAEPSMGDRYVELARKIGMRFNVRIPQNFRRKFCHKCYHYLAKPMVRTKKGFVKMRCEKCGSINRYVLAKKRQTKIYKLFKTSVTHK
jgi:ribonuclease P protein subunit RPR2